MSFNVRHFLAELAGVLLDTHKTVTHLKQELTRMSAEQGALVASVATLQTSVTNGVAELQAAVAAAPQPGVDPAVVASAAQTITTLAGTIDAAVADAKAKLAPPAPATA